MPGSDHHSDGSPGAEKSRPTPSPLCQDACPSDADLRRLLADDPSLTGRVAIEEHLQTCRPCVTRLEELAAAEDDAWSAPGNRVAIGKASREMLARMAQAIPATARHQPAEFPSAESAGEPAVPQIPGFSDLVEVGRGATGIVYRAFQDELGRMVAIKLLSAAGIPGAAARVHREALALARLQHPSVVGIYGTGEFQGVPYLVMEWIAGGTLEDRLKIGPLTVPEAASVVWQLARGVGEAHAVGLVHRDLKPANVLLQFGEPLVAKLTDFGLARDLEPGPRLTATGVVLGTPSYMAPEQTGLISTLGEVGPACDLYGLGAVAYAALVGDPPHQGRSTLDTLVRVAWEEPESLTRRRPEIPRDLATIVSKCLRTHPGDRYRSAGDLADDLQCFLEGRPISARPYTWTERSWKWARRHPAWAATGGLLGLLVMGGILGTAYHVRTLNQTLADLETQTRLAVQADAKATTAIASEQVSRAQSVDQLLLTTQITRLLLERSANPDAQDEELLVSLRHYFHEQAESLEEMSVLAAESLGLGVSNLAYLEGRGGKPEEALEDTRLLAKIADRFPQSDQLQDLRIQVVDQQRSLLELLGQPAEAADSVARLAVGAQAEQLAARGLSAIARSGALMRAGRRNEALRVVEAALPLQQSAVEGAGGDNPELWKRWLTLLSSQGRLLQELGALPKAEDALTQWQVVGRQFVERFPDERAGYLPLQMGIALRQLDLEIGTAQLPKALDRIRDLREQVGEIAGENENEVSLLVDLSVHELRVRAALKHNLLECSPFLQDVVARVMRLREAAPNKFDPAQLECRARMNLAGLYFRTNRAELALTEYERVIELAARFEGEEPPGKSLSSFAMDSHWLAANTSEILGDLEAAQSHLQHVMDHAPDLNRNAAAVRLVVVQLKKRDLPGARAAADQIRNNAAAAAEAMRLIDEGERRQGGVKSLVTPRVNP